MAKTFMGLSVQLIRTETKGLVSAVASRPLLYGLKAPFDEVAVEVVALHPAPNHITPRAA
jgi:hypothetical protein